MRCFSLFLTVLLLIGGCAEETAPLPQDDRPVIGVSLLTLTHPFFIDLIRGLEEEAARQGVSVVVTAAEFDVARQQNQVADFIVQGVDALILCPADSRAIGTTIQAANEAGIPVFTADIAALSEGGSVVHHVGIDNYSGGRMAGEAALEALNGSGTVAIIDHPEVESVILRTRGFREVIEEAQAEGQRVEIISILPAGGSQDRAFRVAEDLLQAHPDLDLIFGINDETALGAVAAIEKAGKAGRVQVVGLGGKTEAKQAVREGRLYADILTYPYQIGVLSVQAVMRYRAGEDLPQEVRIPTTMYRLADAQADTSLTHP